jgi:very-short-patch-repair endonuclease
LVEQAAVMRLLDVAEIDRILAVGRRRGAPLLRSILAAWRTEVPSPTRLRSTLEARLLAAVIDAGLPKPRCNVTLRIDGTHIEVDFLWDEEGVVVEADGARTHATIGAFRRDRWRDQLLAAAGYRTARVTWSHLDDEPEAVLTRIRRMLSERP